MSLPTQEDTLNDHVGRAIDSIIHAIQFAPIDGIWQHSVDFLRLAQKHFKGRTAEMDLASVTQSFVRRVLDSANLVFFKRQVFNSADYTDLVWLKENEKNLRGKVMNKKTSQAFELSLSTVNNFLEAHLMSTILHEMCHMLVMELEFRVRYAGQATHKHLNDPDQHGYHWQRIAKAVEKKARELLHPEIDLKRIDCVILAFKQYPSQASQEWFDALFDGDIWALQPASKLVKAYTDRLYNQYLLEQLPEAETLL